MNEEIVSFIRKIFNTDKTIPLHAPTFIGNEKKYLRKCVESTIVSYVGEFVSRFEKMIEDFTGAKYAIATANGTLGLHTALMLLGVKRGDEVLTSPLTFVATANAISYLGAKCIFIDVDRKTLGISHRKLEEFLKKNTFIKKSYTYNKKTGKRISACIPVHVFGHPTKIDEIKKICEKYNIPVVEDAAESIGSLYKGKHTGTFGDIGVYSFNGNKTITCGGGGMIICNDESFAKRAKHITTTAKVPIPYEYVHDEIGYNYRLTNLNAALGCAQMENIRMFIKNKRDLAKIYKRFFDKIGVNFFSEPEDSKSNYWLNAIIMRNKKERDEFIEYSNKKGIMTRPAWRLLNKLIMYKNCETTDLSNAIFLEERIVNIPSSVRL